MSESGRIVDTVTREALSKPLKADGYKKIGRTFHRASASVTRVVNVQASQGNAGDTGQFTINLGVSIPVVDNLVMKVVRERNMPVREHECTVRMRIGHLMPQHNDHWWKFDHATDLQALITEVQVSWLHCGKPWMEQNWDDLRQARELLKQSNCQVEAIAACVALEEPKLAADFLAGFCRAYREEGHAGQADWLVSRAGDFGVKLPGN